MRAMPVASVLDRLDDISGLLEVDPLLRAKLEAELLFLFASIFRCIVTQWN